MVAPEYQLAIPGGLSEEFAGQHRTAHTVLVLFARCVVARRLRRPTAPAIALRGVVLDSLAADLGRNITVCHQAPSAGDRQRDLLLLWR